MLTILHNVHLSCTVFIWIKFSEKQWSSQKMLCITMVIIRIKLPGCILAMKITEKEFFLSRKLFLSLRIKQSSVSLTHGLHLIKRTGSYFHIFWYFLRIFNSIPDEFVYLSLLGIFAVCVKCITGGKCVSEENYKWVNWFYIVVLVYCTAWWICLSYGPDTNWLSIASSLNHMLQTKQAWITLRHVVLLPGQPVLMHHTNTEHQVDKQHIFQSITLGIITVWDQRVLQTNCGIKVPF